MISEHTFRLQNYLSSHHLRTKIRDNLWSNNYRAKISQSDDLSSKWSLITPCQNKTVNDYTIADKNDQKNILRSASLKLKRPKIISNHSVFEQRTIWSVNLLIKRSRPKSQPILLFLIIMIFGHPTLEKSDLWSHNRKPLWSLSILFKIKANSDQQVSE